MATKGIVVANAPATLTHDKDGSGITSVADTTIATQQRLQVEAELKAGTSVQIGNFPGGNIVNVIRGFVENGGSKDMNINPGGSPDEFTYDADSSDDVVIDELRLVLTFDEIKFESSGNFGPESKLSNGILVEVTSDGNTVELANIKQNEEFLLFPSPSILLELSGADDVIVVSFPLGITLKAGTGDNVKVTIRDNISNSNKKLRFFQGAVTGKKV